MSTHHDPVRQAETISQAYAQDKRPLGLFLSAGCPFSIISKITGQPLVPDIAGLTVAVEAKLAAETAATFKHVSSALVADGVKNPSIEDILSFVRSLHDVVGTAEVRGLRKATIENLDSAISNAIAELVDVDLPEGTSAFEQIARWVGSASREFPVEVFTTNYDLLIERSFERARVPYFDGFSGSDRAFFDQRSIDEERLPPRWARVWKLHGSVNWRIDMDGNTIRTADRSAEDQRLIHPSHLKYAASRRMPYLAMIDRMRSFLKQPTSIMLVCGYSFRDEHLNEALLQGAETNPSAAIFAVQYSKLEDYEPAVRIAKQCQSLNVLASDAAVIGGVEAPWKSARDVISTERLSTFWDKGAEQPDSDLVSGKFLLGDFNSLGKYLSLLISARNV